MRGSGTPFDKYYLRAGQNGRDTKEINDLCPLVKVLESHERAEASLNLCFYKTNIVLFFF